MPIPEDINHATGPPPRPSYLPVHIYTILQVVITVVIFIVTLTRGAPAFPVLIIALVPFRLLVMKRWWPREYLRFVDAWACREGTPEDEEDAAAKESEVHGSGEFDGEVGQVIGRGGVLTGGEHGAQAASRVGGGEMGQDWVELDVRTHTDEELGRSRD